MPNDFSLMDLRIMQYLVTRKSYQDIADIIGCNLPAVAAYLSKFAAGNNIKTYQQGIDEKLKLKKAQQEWKQLKKKKAIADKENELFRKKEQRRRRRIAQEQAIQKRKNPEQIFTTRQQDLSLLRAIRIDHKTVIFIKPDQDAELARKLYLQKRKESIPVATTNYNKVSKFKPIK